MTGKVRSLRKNFTKKVYDKSDEEDEYKEREYRPKLRRLPGTEEKPSIAPETPYNKNDPQPVKQYVNVDTEKLGPPELSDDESEGESYAKNIDKKFWVQKAKPREVHYEGAGKNGSRTSEGYFTCDEIQPRQFTELLEYITEVIQDPDHPWYPLPRSRAADFSWLVMAKRRSGKTTLLKNVIPFIASQFPEVYVFTETKFTGAFDGYLPEEAIFENFNEGVLARIMDRQKKKIDLLKSQVREYKELVSRSLDLSDNEEEIITGKYEEIPPLVLPNPYILLIFDDTAADARIHNSALLNELAFYGRHLGISSWVNSQHGNKINPGFRNNADVAVTFSQVQKNQRECVYENYLSYFHPKSEFNKFLNKWTDEYGFIALLNGVPSLSWAERIFVGAPQKKILTVRMGSAAFWREMAKN